MRKLVEKMEKIKNIKFQKQSIKFDHLDQLREAIMRITLSPIRLNFDQDTLDFLIDFKNDLTQGLRNVFDIPIPINAKKDDDVPVMEVPPKTNEEFVRPTSQTPNSAGEEDDSAESSLHQSFSKGISFNDLKEKDELAATNIGLIN